MFALFLGSLRTHGARYRVILGSLLVVTCLSEETLFLGAEIGMVSCSIHACTLLSLRVGPFDRFHHDSLVGSSFDGEDGKMLIR